MNPQKPTYGEVLKNKSAALNPRMNATALIPNAPRVRLTEESKKNLRAMIHDKPTVKPAKPNNQVVNVYDEVPTLMAMTQPLVLAGASAGVLPKFCMDNRLFMQTSVNSAGVHLMQSNEIQKTVREGVKENPIDILDNSDEEIVESEVVESVDHYSVDGVDHSVKPSEFDANEFMNEVKSESAEVTPKSEPKELPELDRMLRLNPTKALKKSKRRMESSFVDDYCSRMKLFKREYRDEYEGEYTFVVKLEVVDNTVEVKETVTYCKISRLDDETKNFDEDYQPESDFEETYSDLDEKKKKAGLISDVDELRRKENREALCFNPEKQYTRYNKKPVPGKPKQIHFINEKPSETARYAWIARYEPVPSDSTFNMFLNGFKSGLIHRPDGPRIEEFGGVRYRYLRVGTNTVTSPLMQYNQFVIGNDFSIYRLGVNGSPNINLGVNPKARERRLPPPINQKYTIASLFWANELLNTQKAW